MAETRKIFNKKPLSYSGPFRADELYSIIRRFMRERSYYLLETNSQEDILPDGKQIVIEMTGMRQFSDYAKGVIDLGITLKQLNDKVLDVEGHKQKYQTGDVSISVTASMNTDYRNKWEGSGMQFFFRQLSDKFIRRDITNEQSDTVGKDGEDLRSEIKSYLNMHRFKYEHTGEDKETPENKEEDIGEEGEASYSSKPSEGSQQLRVHTVVLHEDKVLLLQRTGSEEWDSLGCSLDDPSNLKKRVLRDLNANAGIDEELVDKIMYGDHIEVNDEVDITIYPVLVTLKAEPEIVLHEQFSGFDWVSFKELRKRKTTEEIHKVLEKVLP